MRILPLFLALALVSAACANEILDPEDAHPRLRSEISPDDRWERVDRDGFSLRVPPGFEKLDLQPIDSDAAAWRAGGSSLHYDYGFYSAAWSRQTDPLARDVVEQKVRIGGRTAQLVAYRTAETWVVQGWWGHLDERAGTDVHLLVRGETDDPAVRELLLAAIHSVRFD